MQGQRAFGDGNRPANRTAGRTDDAGEGPMRHDHDLPDCLRCSELHDFSDLSMPALGAAYRRLVRTGLAVGLVAIGSILVLVG